MTKEDLISRDQLGMMLEDNKNIYNNVQIFDSLYDDVCGNKKHIFSPLFEEGNKSLLELVINRYNRDIIIPDDQGSIMGIEDEKNYISICTQILVQNTLDEEEAKRSNRMQSHKYTAIVSAIVSVFAVVSMSLGISSSLIGIAIVGGAVASISVLMFIKKLVDIITEPSSHEVVKDQVLNNFIQGDLNATNYFKVRCFMDPMQSEFNNKVMRALDNKIAMMLNSDERETMDKAISDYINKSKTEKHKTYV